MEATRPAALSGSAPDHAQLAKATLRRLTLDKLDPTPENYAKAWRQESGEPPVPAADGPAIAALIERIVRGIERGSRGWTTARKKDSLQRVLTGSRSDARRLQQRLTQLVASWDSDTGEAEAAAPWSSDETVFAGGPELTLPAPLDALADVTAAPAPAAWGRAVDALGGTLQLALPPQDDAPHQIASALAALVDRITADGATPALIDALEALCRRAAPILQHRHHLHDQLNGLCAELTASLTDLAENESWAKGQCEAMQVKIDEGLTARGIRAVSELLRDTRARQGQLREERARARDSLKGLINRMLSELDELGSQTGNFHDSVGRYADVIGKADSLESLTGVVREMVEESRTVQALVQQTQARLQAEHGKAQGLTQRVNELESEMQRLSSEVSTDQLTQIANRRGLLQAFDTECARLERSAATLSVGLLDIDNFKRLNDELGHGAGDEALKSLAAVVSTTLRPTDHVARYGGEEFVVLLPDTPVDEGLQILTRLQRSLTGGLFMHEQKQIFVTFSAGVTAYRPGERIEEALERADQGLYEAKRTGKNRTCLG
ncbi:MAG: diguanylate cyclase [Pseudomonadota bacterium]